MKIRTTLGAAIAMATIALALTTPTACDVGEECLVDGENCSQDYIEANYSTYVYCCDGLSCQEGTINPDVLICR